MSLNLPLDDRDRSFRLLFDGHPQPMWVVDPQEGKILEANAAAANLYGYSQDEFRGLDLQAIESPHEAGHNGHTHHRTRQGEMVEIESASQPLEYQGQDAELVTLTDVTARRRQEEHLRQAQKMEAVGMLAGGVAHDFNNLLTIISGYSQLILQNLPPSDPNHNSAEQIMKAGERAAQLTGQLLAFSRRQTPQLRPLDLNRLVSAMSPMLRRLIGEDIELEFVLRPELGMVSADPGQMEQVLMNLAVNARDAMPKGGKLTIETANTILDEGYSQRHLPVKPGPYTMIAVSDNGAGMDEAAQRRLFEPFFTTKGVGRGTGLGLVSVFGIVKQSGGSIDVYSVPNRGTSMKVYLPRIDRAAVTESEAPRQTVSRGSETILVVEDDEMVRHLVCETLNRAGYHVLDAAGPVEARRIANAHRGRIQLLITDVVLPKTSGRELAAQLTARRRDLKVLYMSGYTDSAIVNTGILQKEVAFLQKPFTPAAFTQKVREVLEGGSRTRGAAE
jgi:two-component system, cell cycle sensor histidine kinase and response regulator CckA